MNAKLGIALLLAGSIHAEVNVIGLGLAYDDVLLVPQKSVLSSRKDANLQTRLTNNITLNIPLISANMDTVTEAPMAIALALSGGIGIIHRFNTIEQQVEEVEKVKQYSHESCRESCTDSNKTIEELITRKNKSIRSYYPSASLDEQGCLLVGAAIGVKEDTIERATALVQAGVDVLVLDIAHGHSDLAITTLKQVRKLFPHIDLIAGNVVTAHATRELIFAGANAIKVGVGPGSVCTTRIVTGCGYPQLSAVLVCAQEADRYGIPVIADGGIRYSGDITKAIAAGASTVMLGNLFAGTDESPGVTIIKDGKKYKAIRGMASLGAYRNRNAASTNKVDTSDFVPEGVEAIVPYKGSVMELIKQLNGGLCSGISYCGVTSLYELRGNGIFIEITHSGQRESHAHDVQQVTT